MPSCSRLLSTTLALALSSALCFPAALPAQTALSKVWNPDRGDGTYTNPILFADYSDPDVVRVGKDFYLVSSSFDQVPGLPILHSIDLVHWELIAHALPIQVPEDRYRQPQHGNGAWAPAIRFHDGVFYIFYPDPDFGIYMTKAASITGPWSEPVLVKGAKGWIDPCPLWDDDGNAYLVNGLAASRAGAKSAVVLSRMAADGSHLLDDGVLIIDGHEQDPTLEGPKIYKRGGYYYVFAPAGGVTGGWQVVFRSPNIYGPYERRVVLAQGHTAINGPHQGAWVNTDQGEDWFIHFQDQGPYGRVVLLEPMQWQKDGWPIIGIHQDANGLGEPAASFRLPKLDAPRPAYNPADSDEFNGAHIGLQWQWQANPGPTWAFPFPGDGVLRLMNVYQNATVLNLWNVPNLLLQKFPARTFTATAKFSPHLLFSGEQTGLVVMGHSYAALLVRKTPEGLVLVQSTRLRANINGQEDPSIPVLISSPTLYFRARIDADSTVRFSYSTDGLHFDPFGKTFRAEQGDWIGAKIGIFATGVRPQGESGYSDFDWFRIEK
jgi:beta-xylosidase